MLDPDLTPTSSPATPGADPVTPGPAAEQPAPTYNPQSLGNIVWEVLQTLVLAGLLIVIFRTFIFQNYIVEGNSMLPTLLPNERVIVSRINYLVGEPQRGDVIVFQFPNDPGRDFVKRIIGLPGETLRIDNGQVFINGQPLPFETYIEYRQDTSTAEITLADDQYFVMGDNRAGSSDSRSWGPLAKHYIIGKAWLVYFPFTNLGLVPHIEMEPGA